MLALLGVLAIALVGLELSQKSSVSVLGPIVPGPLTGYTFAIDPGHGGEDGGAVGPSGTLEARLNLSVAGYLAEELRSRGANIILTRENDDALAEGKMEDLRKRREILTSEGLTASISVHMNKHTKPDANGPRLFYCQGSEVGKALATLVLHNIEDALGRKQTAPFVGDYFVIKGRACPVSWWSAAFSPIPRTRRCCSPRITSGSWPAASPTGWKTISPPRKICPA